jgi:hypothetical protein
MKSSMDISVLRPAVGTYTLVGFAMLWICANAFTRQPFTEAVASKSLESRQLDSTVTALSPADAHIVSTQLASN